MAFSKRCILRPKFWGTILLLSGCTADNEPPPELNDAFPSDYSKAMAVIDGEGDPESLFEELSWSGGFPIQGPGDRWLFIADGAEGPLKLSIEFESPRSMNASGNLYWIEVDLSESKGVKYHFLTASNQSIADPYARSYDYDGADEFSYVEPPFQIAHFERWPNATTHSVVPRTLRVLVPDGPGPWPLLMAQDGNNLFDPAAMWGGWRLQDAAAEMKPLLIVGIDNTAERISEYTHTTDQLDGTLYGGGGTTYATFVHETVRPHIEQHYPVSGARGLIGSSLGGLISLYISHVYPGEYDFVASLSGTLGWGRFEMDNAVMEELYLLESSKETVLYIDSGGSSGDGACEDLDGDGFVEDDPNDSDNYCVNRQFVDRMAESGYRWNETLFHWWEPDAPHNELAWAERVHRPLEIFANLNE